MTQLIKINSENNVLVVVNPSLHTKRYIFYSDTRLWLFKVHKIQYSHLVTFFFYKFIFKKMKNFSLQSSKMYVIKFSVHFMY